MRTNPTYPFLLQTCISITAVSFRKYQHDAGSPRLERMANKESA